MYVQTELIKKIKPDITHSIYSFVVVLALAPLELCVAFRHALTVNFLILPLEVTKASNVEVLNIPLMFGPICSKFAHCNFNIRFLNQMLIYVC